MVKFFRLIQTPVVDRWNKLRFSVVSEKRQRIIALDILRGLFLMVLIVNHIPWSPSLYSFVAGRSELFASAAEGFFVVSGILVGYIYGQKIIGSTRETFRRIWKRSLILALLSIGGTLLFTLLALWSSPSVVGMEPWSGSVSHFIFNTFTLRYSYGWIDFLNRYAIFMLVAPFALWLVTRHKAWIVLVVSLLTWLLLRDNVYGMPFLAWQLVFMYGIVIGYYLPEIEGRVKKWPERGKHIVLTAVITIATLTYVVSVWWSVVLPFILTTWNQHIPASMHTWLFEISRFRDDISNTWFSKATLAPGRVIIGTLWFIALYALVRIHESRIVSWKLGRIIEYLGKHSLFVYVSHAVIIVLTNILLSPPVNYTNIFVNTLIVTFLVWVIYTMAARRERFDKLITHARHRIRREDF